MKRFDPAELPHPQVHRLLLSGVAPRPIAFVSSMDKNGAVNLAPFSFFNAFGVNPPVICFSPAFSGKTGAPKDTLLNLLETKECTISIVTYDMVEQVSLASAPYPKGENEFIKAGFTPFASEKVTPPGVAESPFIMEAKLLHHIDFGGKPGSANLLICEILLFHINERVFNEQEQIDPRLMDQVARMGGSWYSRAAKGLFSLPQPTVIGACFDKLPLPLRHSEYLSGSDLAKLLSAPIDNLSPELPATASKEAHLEAKQLIETNNLSAAWKRLLS